MTQDWRHRAACRNLDPEIFFPVGTSGPALLQIVEAKSICRRCPVAAECLTWALESGQDYGVWGGTSEDERRALARRAGRSREHSADPAPRPRPDPEPLTGRQRRGARVRAEGIALLLDGATPRQVADETGVDERTAQRWAARPEVRRHVPRTVPPQSQRDPLSRRSLACARTGS
jgi:WhiB family redox-sensing transcriptional regulator